MLGNKKIMGNNILFYINERQIDRKEFAKIIGVPYSTLTGWINGITYPRIDRIQKMADYFGIEKADLVEEHKEQTTFPVYYTDPETAQIAQEVFDNPDLRILFSAARDAKPEDIKLAADMLKRFKETNPDG